jgi:ABC-type transport system involved in multi-copper enzyme maturation permease subunit
MRFFEICKSFYESRLLTIAVITAREITRQTLFYFILGGGCFVILFSSSFTMFAFGEEARMIKEMGVSTIMLCCLCLASLSATSTVSLERERSTLITLLCKPVDKRSVLLGKFFGIVGVVFFACMTMGFFLTLSLTIKGSPECHKGFVASLVNIGGLVFLELLFSFLQVAIICSIAILGSIYLPMVSNLVLCMVLYVIGNLAQSFHGIFQGNGSVSALVWFLSFFFVIFPNLSDFSSTVGIFERIGFAYIALLVLYTILYITFVITMACELFDRKEYS